MARRLALAALALGCAAPAQPDFSGCADSDRRRPVPVVRVEPIHPEPARRARIEGWVEIEASIGHRGQVVDPVVVESQPPGLFDSAALYAIAHWQYCPPSVSDPYPERIWTRLAFELADEPAP